MQKKGLIQKCLTGNVRLKQFGKTTDNNALPDGWIKKPLKELVEMVFSSVNKKSRSDQKTVQLCNYMDVYNNDYITDGLDFMTATASDREIEKFILQQGDVIITKDSETPDDIGVPAVVMENLDNVICGYHLALLRPNQNEIDGIFLAKELARDRVSYQFSRVANGATRFGLTTDAVRNIKVNVPPLPEQKKIARILGTWDRAIDLTERLIEAKERQKKGLMQQLLTGKMRFREFVQSDKMQQSKVGLIPEDWDILALKKICLKFSNGGTPSRKIAEYWNGKIPWITGADFLEQKIATVRRFITQEAIKASSTNLMPKGSLLVVTRTGVGKLALAPFDVAISQDITGVYPESEKVDSEYLFSYLDAFKGRLERLSQGTSINGITRDLLAKQIIPLPSLVEQRKIAMVLSKCSREIELLSRKLDVLKDQKKGLMQQLLTGQVRVKI